MQLRDLVQEWLQKAQDDLDSAEFLSDMKPLPKDIIGFHCQHGAFFISHIKTILERIF